jgi:hypothetical protein
MWQWKAVDKALPVDRHPRLLLLAWSLALYVDLPRAALSEHMRAHEATSCWRQRDHAATGAQAASADIRKDTLDRLEALAHDAGRTVEKKVYTDAPYEEVIEDIRRHTDGGAPCLVLGQAGALHGMIEPGCQLNHGGNLRQGWHPLREHHRPGLGPASASMPALSTPRLVYAIRQEGGSRHIETLDLGRGRAYLAQDTPAFWCARKGHAAEDDADLDVDLDLDLDVDVDVDVDVDANADAAANVNADTDADAADCTLSLQVYFFPARGGTQQA